jgi:hypothetical protein
MKTYKYKSITLNGRKHYADIWKAVKEARRESRECGESLNDIDGLTVNAIHLYDDKHFYYYVTSGEDWDGGVVSDEEDARLVFGPGITKNREKIIEKIEDMGQSCPVYLADDGRGNLIEIDSFDDVENWAREEFSDEKCLYRPTEQLENGIVWERWIRGGSCGCEWIFGGRALLDRSASKMDVIEAFIEIPEDFTE